MTFPTLCVNTAQWLLPVPSVRHRNRISARTADPFPHTGSQQPQVTVTKKAEQGKTPAVHQEKPRHSAPRTRTKDYTKALTTNVFEKGKEKQIHERSKRNFTFNAQDFFWIFWDNADCGTRSAQTAQNDSTKQTGKSFLTLKHRKTTKQNFIVPLTLNPFSFFPHTEWDYCAVFVQTPPVW